MRTQRGNILFLILLAVVLFAALSYAVTNAMRGGGNDGSKERADSFAATLIQHANLIEQTMQRAILVNGVRDYGFDVSGLSSMAATNATCTNTDCKIYDDNGGKVAGLTIPDWASTSSGNRKATFRAPVVMNVNTTAPDLVMYYSHLTQEVCEALNRKLGPDIPLTNETFGTAGTYSGTLTSFPTEQGTLGDDVPALKGKNAFCLYNSSSGYMFVYVLIAR